MNDHIGDANEMVPVHPLELAYLRACEEFHQAYIGVWEASPEHEPVHYMQMSKELELASQAVEAAHAAWQAEAGKAGGR